MYPSRAAACQRQWRCPGVRTLWISLLLQGLLDMSASGESNLKLHTPSDSLHTFPTMMRSVNRDGCTWSPGPADHLSCAVCLFVCLFSFVVFVFWGPNTLLLRRFKGDCLLSLRPHSHVNARGFWRWSSYCHCKSSARVKAWLHWQTMGGSDRVSWVSYCASVHINR